jgi:hypothetical protein
MTCPKCGSHNVAYHAGCRGDRHHPSEPAGWECIDCGTFETEYPGARAEARADDDRDHRREMRD